MVWLQGLASMDKTTWSCIQRHDVGAMGTRVMEVIDATMDEVNRRERSESIRDHR